MRRFCFIVALIVLGGWTAGNARAAITYQYVTDATNYNAAAGASVVATVYLQETVTGSDTSLIAPENGLYSAGFGTQQTGTVPTGATTISKITPNTTTEPNGFNGNTSQSVSATKGYELEVTSNSDITAGGPSGTTTGGSVTATNGTTTTDVLLGTITLTAGAAGTTTSFTIQSAKDLLSPQVDGNTLTFTNGYDLDQNGGSAQGASVNWTGADSVINTFTVTATPEPSSLWLSGLVVPVAGVGAWLRWRQRAVVMA